MNSLIIATLIALSSAKAFAVGPANEMPILHKIQYATLSGSYNCSSGRGDFELFLSEASAASKNADLFLLDGCDLDFTLASGLAGFATSVIADLGKVPLEEINRYKALSLKWTVGESNNFRRAARLVVGHSYSIVLNTAIARGIVVLSVDSIQNGQVKVRYAVKRYSVIEAEKESDDVSYERGSMDPGFFLN